MSVDGCSFIGEKSMDDYGTIMDRNIDAKKCNGYKFEVSSDSAWIWKDGEDIALKSVDVNYKLKQITETLGFK